MEENPDGKTYIREMEFVDGDDVRVSVRIESRKEGLRSAAIRSAMVNHCSLYPVEQVAPADRDISYWWFVIAGLLPLATAFGFVVYSGMTLGEIMSDGRTRNLMIVQVILLPLFCLASALMEFGHSQSRRKARAASDRYAARQAPAPQPDAHQGPA